MISGVLFLEVRQMDMNAPETDIGQKSAQLTDRDLHCVARLLQSEYAEDSVQCLYCKYVFQCREMFLETHEIPYLVVLEKLKGITGVNVHLVNPRGIQKNILAFFVIGTAA